jgi:hypothetical protein
MPPYRFISISLSHWFRPHRIPNSQSPRSNLAIPICHRLRPPSTNPAAAAAVPHLYLAYLPPPGCRPPPLFPTSALHISHLQGQAAADVPHLTRVHLPTCCCGNDEEEDGDEAAASLQCYPAQTRAASTARPRLSIFPVDGESFRIDIHRSLQPWQVTPSS